MVPHDSDTTYIKYLKRFFNDFLISKYKIFPRTTWPVVVYTRFFFLQNDWKTTGETKWIMAGNAWSSKWLTSLARGVSIGHVPPGAVMTTSAAGTVR